jgi:glucose-6-phosphate 1-dehydrogenase
MTEVPKSDGIVVFGVTGDLVHKEIFPALQGLVRDEGLNVPIVGVARSDWTAEGLRARAKDSLEKAGSYDDSTFARLAGLLDYVQGDYGDPGTCKKLHLAMRGARRPLFYMAIPPSVFPVVTEALFSAGCTSEARVVVEKPFGRDLASALDLNRTLQQHFPESSIFRIDHYLGKEPVQNITYTRFANPVLEPIWNREHVRCIQVTMAENYGVKTRGLFYEEAGAIRDVVQNHLLQLLAILMMDAPGGNSPDAIRDEKTRLLKAVKPLEPDHVVRGQYRGYRSAAGVAPDSDVETYVALRLQVDNWRWAGVPVYVRTGKELTTTATEAFVELRRPPREVFGELVSPASSHVRMRLSPDVVIAMGMRIKVPGERMIGKDVELTVTSAAASMKPAYQRLLSDAMRGIHELFARQDGVEASWRIVDPILGGVTPLYPYEPGSWGPGEAENLIGPDGPWIAPTG